ncbi:acetyltransferase [Kordiimonas sp. SCSIO 12610]|uniref:acetyltransferase n=1 Tax=Kordiimonas sp. SCSIO 12610 TaxID=2829597 RepID=UPI00210B0A2E|nr:acetyltransferase [Kordiimonas sp. SCSIO 12610]UTW56542.1 acetyltransferase [Kordiimonas sp. SCSIO 12610]
MTITMRAATPSDHSCLFDIWQTAVAATHDFLSEKDAAEIADLVRDHYIPNAEFMVTVDQSDTPTAFIGMTDNSIDALFVHSDHHGEGIGSFIVKQMQSQFETLTLDVNEGNPGARAFYEKHGFEKTGRSETDDQGRPYPLIHMAWRR